MSKFSFYFRTYYADKNMYDGPLPITPLTRPVTDRMLISSLYSYATKNLKHGRQLRLIEAFETASITASNTNNGVIYDLRFINSHGEQYYALIHAL